MLLLLHLVILVQEEKICLGKESHTETEWVTA